MQLALTPEVLVPVGAGALLLVIALVAVPVVARRRRRARALAAAVADPAAVDPAPGTDPAPDPDPGNGTGHDGAWSGPSERVGSGRTVAAAVAQALAAREAQARAGGSTPVEPATGPVRPAPDTAARNGVPHPVASVAPEPAAPGRGSSDVAPQGEPVTPDVAPSARGDARDRLLAVLLDDPVRAVGATVELDACRRQLARLTDSVRHEREALRSVLARLADTGLGRDQLARLSGLSDAELRDLLPDRIGVR